MRLANTKQYYKELRAHFLQKELGELAGYAHGLASEPKFSYSKTNTSDWFEDLQIERPEIS